MKTKKSAAKSKLRTSEPKPYLKDEDLRPENVKVRVNMFMDLDVVEHFRKLSKTRGLGYQTLINQALKEHIQGPHDLESRVAALEKKVG
jgi:uncharacterized protein (DUF4415 family)